jgi:translocator protein
MNINPNWWTLPEYIAPAIGILVAVWGGLLTEVGPWYKKLQAPVWKPPDWAFGPIWTVIITLAVIASVLAWRKAPDETAHRWILISFGLNCALNIAWSWLFFKRKRPDWALIETVFLWLSIVFMIAVVYPISSTATWCLVPYLVWVTIASVLNWVTVRMNGPFHPV